MPAGSQLAIAYEPLRAIGSGDVPGTVEVLAHLRSCPTARFGEGGATIRILYGGSVEAGNARAILNLPAWAAP